jgi:MFS family permease
MSAINAMPAYWGAYGMTQAGSSTGITFAIYNIGGIAAVPIGGPMNDYLGRKWAMFIGCSLVIIGTCVQAPSKSMSAFLGGRFLLGLGASFCAISAPTYASEMAHPYWRGALTGLYNVCWYVVSFFPENSAIEFLNFANSNLLIGLYYCLMDLLWNPETYQW